MSLLKRQYETVLVSREGGITTITLNRPEFSNAMSPQFMTDLSEAAETVSKDAETRVVIVTGVRKAFCAGGDVAEDIAKLGQLTPFEYQEHISLFWGAVRKIYWMQKPVIAAINGAAIGGGCDLAMACDIRIASDKAKFGAGYITMGLVSELGGNYSLPRLIGLGKAKLLAFTGDIIDAKRAEEIGLVDQVVESSEFDVRVKELAEKLAKGPTVAMVMYKLAMNKSLSMDLDTSCEYSQNLCYFTLSTEDYREGFQAFLEKRPPIFKGK
jgi:enoyl-CoA hydratase